ncbi:MAG: hypothetical protein LBG29_00640 [Synergistaceae bacterium]|nr:hypothetical protein [Synergistaceae bacterium]
MDAGRPEPVKTDARRRRALRAVFFVIAVAFILIGWHRGEIRTVFIKAATICLECIGIG